MMSVLHGMRVLQSPVLGACYKKCCAYLFALPPCFHLLSLPAASARHNTSPAVTNDLFLGGPRPPTAPRPLPTTFFWEDHGHQPHHVRYQRPFFERTTATNHTTSVTNDLFLGGAAAPNPSPQPISDAPPRPHRRPVAAPSRKWCDV